MTLAHRVVRAIQRFLKRNAAEFAVLDVTRDEAMRPSGNAPVTPADLHGLKPVYAAWLILHYADIMDSGGCWPEITPEEIPTHSGHCSDGWFVNPVMWAAEISTRVDECCQHGRPDGNMLWLYYRDGEPIGKLAGKYGMDEERVCKAINRALRYCSGKDRRPMDYESWCQHRNTNRVDMRETCRE